MRPVVTLTTDFGDRDPYAAAMKGVVLSICPEAAFVDLTHAIAPQDVFEAALFIAGSTPYFPDGTIHCVVVDPEVGSERAPMAARCGAMTYVCPDNGLLTMVEKRLGACEVRRISNPACFRSTVSATFHGRDVFAVTAARLACGMEWESIGDPLEGISRLDVAEPTVNRNVIVGQVIHVDRFGNAITNIHRIHIAARSPKLICAGPLRLAELARTYANVSHGDPVGLFGSSDLLEIAVNRGNARERFGLSRGTEVRVEL